MTTSEKVAYLKGLADGLVLDKDVKQDKLIAAIIDVLDTVAQDLDELDDTTCELSDEIDAISDDLSDVEDIVYDDYDDDDEDYDEYEDEDECCGGHHHHECCCGGDEDEDPVFYEVTCPACNNTITVDEDVLALGTIQCPSCGETLEFDFGSIEDEADPEETK